MGGHATKKQTRKHIFLEKKKSKTRKFYKTYLSEIYNSAISFNIFRTLIGFKLKINKYIGLLNIYLANCNLTQQNHILGKIFISRLHKELLKFIRK